MNKEKWDRTCMSLAYSVAEHATCLRRKVGAVISKDHRIIATGFNGAPEGIPHCTSCMRDELNVPSGQRHELSMAVHAEMNAIIQCALYGVSPEGATIYITVTPCSMCLKALINARIKRIVIDSDTYPDELSRKLLEQSGIQLDVLSHPETMDCTNSQISEPCGDRFASIYVADYNKFFNNIKNPYHLFTKSEQSKHRDIKPLSINKNNYTPTGDK